MAYKVRGKPFEKGATPWNKGTVGLQKAWNKGVTGYISKPNGISHQPGYKKMLEVWTNIKNRCSRSETHGYERYGGRGIKMCDRWLDFKNFYEDMYPSFKEGLSIERINNEGNYSPENCTWVTWREQCMNRRSNRLISYKGIVKHLSVWARDLGIKRSTLEARLDKYSWGVERSFGTPVRRIYG